MTWRHVARKDFQYAVKSRAVWALTGFLSLLVVGAASIPYLTGSQGSSAAFTEAMATLFIPIGLLVPLIGLLVGHRAIVGERESGSVRFLLGLPNTRLDVVIGKTVGRFFVFAVPTLAGYLVGAIVVFVLYDGFDLVGYVALTAFTLLMGLVYVVIAVGVSASVDTNTKAAAGVFGIYMTFYWLWQFVPDGVHWALTGSLPSGTSYPPWYVLVERLSPGGALEQLAYNNLAVLYESEFLNLEGSQPTEAAFYLEEWFAVFIVLGWLLVPLVVGYARFERAALN